MSFAFETIEVSPPAAPGIGATITLFDTTTMFGGEAWNVIAAMNMSRVVVTFSSLSHDSAAAGLLSQESTNGGANWDTTETGVQITAASTVGAGNTHDYAIDRFKDFRLTYTNGGTLPTTWRVSIKVICGDRAVVT
jgi:hypothetical protein